MDDSRDILMKHLIELLEKKEFQDTLVEELNDNIDIPFVGEKSEGKIFKALLGVVLKTVKKYEHVLIGG